MITFFKNIDKQIFISVYLRICIFLVLILLVFSSSAQQNYHTNKTRILFLLDASGSMYARMDKDTRINVAKKLLSKIIDSLENAKGVELALRVYGHTSPPNRKDCSDTRLEVAFKKDNHAEIQKRIQNV